MPGPIVGGDFRHPPGPVTCWRRYRFFRPSIRRCCHRIPRLAKADKKVPGFGRVIKRVARFVSRKWPEPIYALRRELGLPRGGNPLFDAKHSPSLVLALFSRVLGTEPKGLAAERADHRLRVLRRRCRHTRNYHRILRSLSPAAAAGCVYAGFGRGAGCGKFL